MPAAACQELAVALAQHAKLVLPSSMYQDHQPTTQETTAHLADLAQRSPGVFLQRYGKLMTPEQLAVFEPVKDDYEVNHWLLHYSQQAQHTRDVEVVNRRLAALQQLQAAGDYFSMSVMRERAPLLYHQYIGQYVGDALPTDAGQGEAAGEGSAAPSVAPAATRLSESIMQQHDRLQRHMLMQREQEQEDAQMSEHESDEEDAAADGAADGAVQDGQPSPNDAGSAGPGAAGAAGQAPAPPRLSPAALVRKRREFQQEMEQRFLFGQDAGFDYQAVDEDADGKLDDHWATQVNRDAQDAYFDAIDDADDEPAQPASAALAAGRPQAAGAPPLGPDEYDY